MNGKPRKPLKRYTPLKRVPLARGDSQLKRTGRLRPVSKKRAKKMKELSPVRAAYKAASKCGLCLLTGNDTEPDDVHELIGGPVRPRTMQEPQFWLAVCRACHDEYQSTDTLGEQYAAKVRAEFLTLNERLQELGRKQIEWSEVEAFLP